MIVYSPDFLDAEAATDTPLTHARIGYQTWTRGLAASAATGSTDTSSTPEDAPLRPDTYEYWQATSLPATWQADLGQARAVDYVGIAGHTLGSEGASILVEYSADAASWFAFASANPVEPANDAPLLFLDYSVSARYWRLSIDGVDSPGDPPQIAVVYIGEVLKMQRMIYGGHSPMPLRRDTVLRNALSRGGRFLGQTIRRRGVTGEASFRHLTPSWYRSDFDPFVKDARQYPFFFAWRPAADTDEVAFAWATDDIAPTNMGLSHFMQVSFGMRGIGYAD